MHVAEILVLDQVELHVRLYKSDEAVINRVIITMTKTATP